MAAGREQKRPRPIRCLEAHEWDFKFPVCAFDRDTTMKAVVGVTVYPNNPPPLLRIEKSRFYPNLVACFAVRARYNFPRVNDFDVNLHR
jgi:hypothetical protein